MTCFSHDERGNDLRGGYRPAQWHSGKTCRLHRHLTGRPDVAFYGMDAFVEIQSEMAGHMSTFFF